MKLFQKRISKSSNIYKSGYSITLGECDTAFRGCLGIQLPAEITLKTNTKTTPAANLAEILARSDTLRRIIA